MNVTVAIIDGPLTPGTGGQGAPATDSSGAGATLVFEGIVREREGEGMIDALDYEAYEPMASKMLRRIGEEIVYQHRLLGLHVLHSRGRVNVGAISFRLSIAASHRKEALAAMDEFIDRMKQDVPIWKKPVWR
jgi:molybdopterin synthase catalytic subunit